MLLKDLVPGDLGNGASDFVDAGRSVFFESGGALWKTDGTSAGTVLISDNGGHGFGFGSTTPPTPVMFNGDAYFNADDGVHDHQLWKTDGTAAGTVMVADINPTGNASPEELSVAGGLLYFCASDGVHVRSLWRTDGTAGGTIRLSDDRIESPVFDVGGSLLYSGSGGLGITDGTPAGTGPWKSFIVTGFDSTAFLNGRLFFDAEDSSGSGVWVTDGTLGGTVAISSAGADLMTVAGNSLFFRDFNTLWMYDGASTHMVVSTSPMQIDGSIDFAMVPIGDGVVLFAGTDPVHHSQLWRSDGTAAGTFIVKEVNPSDTSFVDNLTNLDGTTFFNAWNGHETDLWRSDGTAAGTQVVRQADGTPMDTSGKVTAIRGTLYFSNFETTHGDEPWVYHVFPFAGPVSVTAADAGGGPDLRIFDAVTGGLLGEFMAYDPRFTGGVRVAVGDVNGDGIPDIITVPGPGGGPDLRVWDGWSGQLIREYMVYSPSFAGGVWVATGDVNGDGFSDIITGADAGGGPHVKVVSGKDGSVLYSFYAYGAGFTGGVRVAAGDVNRDGRADIITAPGPGGGPHIEVWSGASLQLLQSYFAYGANFSGGVYVAAGDVNGDGVADIITGPGAGGGPNVKVFSGLGSSLLQNFMAYSAVFAGGVRVGFVADVSGGAIAVVPGPGGGPHLQLFDGRTLQVLDSLFAYASLFTGGLYVGGS
jgi:ELWxxDGT repeat protein